MVLKFPALPVCAGIGIHKTTSGAQHIDFNSGEKHYDKIYQDTAEFIGILNSGSACNSNGQCHNRSQA
jgi:hypothetical protein